MLRFRGQPAPVPEVSSLLREAAPTGRYWGWMGSGEFERSEGLQDQNLGAVVLGFQRPLDVCWDSGGSGFNLDLGSFSALDD